MTALLLMLWNQRVRGEARWAILSVFPKPMPFCLNAKLFSCLFDTIKTFDVPYLPLNTEIAGFGDYRTLALSSNFRHAFVQRDCVSALDGVQTPYSTIT